MFGWGDAEDSAKKVDNDDDDGNFSHELIAGAAGFKAMRTYHKFLAKTGHPQDYALFKEILAGIAAAEAEKLIEEKALDYLDRDEAKKQAVDQVNALADEKFKNGDDQSWSEWFDDKF